MIHLIGITGDGRPMSAERANEILSADPALSAVESPQDAFLRSPPPTALLWSDKDTAAVCAWHDGGRGKTAAEKWAAERGLRVTHGCCPRCSADIKAGRWRKL
jgi:hypothetical protein